MSDPRHFGMIIARLSRFTLAETVRASEDCRLVCSACFTNCYGLYRLRGETEWLCHRCTGIKENGQVPGPRLYDTQPTRRLQVGEQLRSPEGIWTATSSQRTPTREEGYLLPPSVYVLTRDDGHEETWRARDMADADFHVIPSAFEHIDRARCTELGRALTAAGLLWEDNGRQATPKHLTYTVTDPRCRRWTIRPVGPFAFSPAQPSRLWRAVCRAVPTDHSPAMSACELADHIREFPA